MSDYSYETLDTPIGEITIVASTSTAGIVGAYFAGQRKCPTVEPGWRCGGPLCDRAKAQLIEYFAGKRRAFALPLVPVGTPFQQRVWRALRDITFGHTRSYADLAAAIGRDNAARAVGAANGRNPISIIVPCHRVIGANGSLTGYAGGLARKRWLLDHEARLA